MNGLPSLAHFDHDHEQIFQREGDMCDLFWRQAADGQRPFNLRRDPIRRLDQDMQLVAKKTGT